MNCYVHQDKMAGNTCSQCGNWICNDCIVPFNGRLICKGCVEEIAKNAGTEKREHGHAAPPYEVVGSPHPKHYKRGAVRDINGFFLFCLSAIPGLNFMYLGLMKKGLLLMSAFFLSIYLTSYLPMMGFIIFMILCASFFDGFSVRRRLLLGETVDDNIDDVILFMQKHRGSLIFLGGMILALGFIGRIRWVSVIFIVIFEFLSSIASIGIIVLGIYIIYQAFNKKSDNL